MLVKRVGDSTDRLTNGKYYTVIQDTITDDNGHVMKPCLSKPKYWEIVDLTEEENTMSEVPVPAKELLVEDVTLINGMRAEEVRSDALVDLIIGERQKIEHLELIGVGDASSYVRRATAHHQLNIKDICNILDKREDYIDRLGTREKAVRVD